VQKQSRVSACCTLMPILITQRSCLDSSSKKQGGQLFYPKNRAAVTPGKTTRAPDLKSRGNARHLFTAVFLDRGEDGLGIAYPQHPRLHDCTAVRAHAPWMGGGGETSTLSQEPVPWSRSEAGGLLFINACVLGQPLPPVFAYCSNERANSHYQYIKTRHRAV
jgi:hypothetical protein